MQVSLIIFGWHTIYQTMNLHLKPKINISMATFKFLLDIIERYHELLTFTSTILKSLIDNQSFLYSFTDSMKTIRLDN